MATLYITELNYIGKDANGANVQAAAVPPVAEQVVAIAGASAQSAALNVSTNMVRLMADAACSVKFGSNPTATATSMRLAADAGEYFSIPAGQSFKVAVISNS